MTEQHTQLLESFRKADMNLATASTQKSRKTGHEMAYNAAYKKLVDAGLAIKLKGKYNS